MKKFLFLCLTFLCALTGQSQLSHNPWEDSIVTVEITRQRYDMGQPWTRQTATDVKNAIVIEGKEILTTAEFFNDVTLIRVQRNGRGRWWTAKLKWADYHANVALLSVEEAEFWPGLKAAKFATDFKDLSMVQVVRWRNGNLESRKAEFNEFTVREGKVSFVPSTQIIFSSEIEGLGWAEAVVNNGKLVGLTTSSDGRKFNVMPVQFFRRVLDARAKGKFTGMGYFAFTWQQTLNPDAHKFLGWKTDPKGVVIIDIPDHEKKPDGLKERDLILKVDGFDIDIQGDYVDPEYGHLMLETLSSRRHWAGDTIKIVVWRDAKEVTVDYTLPKADYATDLIPKEVFDKEPEYLMVGGLLFQPLDGPFLKRWGGDWKQRAPFRLAYYDNQSKSEERAGLVLLSAILPDPVNIGYQDYRFIVLDKVNGKAISNLMELAAALQTPKDGFHILEFMEGSSIQKMVLDASQASQASARIQSNYGIRGDRNILAGKTLAK
ncbi:MAG TPA: serine protease [Verrucomicrobiae bacterium]